MTSQTPPYPYFNGITYNPSFFSSSSSSTTGNYLNYPIAQGTETISTLYTSTIDSSTPSSAITLFGSQTANLTMATAVTGTSVSAWFADERIERAALRLSSGQSSVLAHSASQRGQYGCFGQHLEQL